jgi:hypothetical protein
MAACFSATQAGFELRLRICSDLPRSTRRCITRDGLLPSWIRARISRTESPWILRQTQGPERVLRNGSNSKPLLEWLAA